MKKFVLGLLLGIITTFSVTVYAAVELKVIDNPFPVLINGQASEVEGYNINGYTYLKLADFKKAGLTIKFNETDKQIEVTTDTINGIGVDSVEGTVEETKITKTPDGITQIDNWEGNQYIGESYIKIVINKKGYDLTRIREPIINQETGVITGYIADNKWKLIKGIYDPQKSRVDQSANYEILLDDVPMTMTYGYESVEVGYYINTILPLIQ